MRKNVLSHLQGWRLSPRRSQLSLVGHKCCKTCVTVLLLDRDVWPFTMSRTLLLAFDYYGLGLLLLNQPTSCPAGRYAGSVRLLSRSWSPEGLHQADSWLAVPGLWIPRVPNWAKPQPPASHVKQTSPDKSMNCRSTTASFTISVEPWALLSCANLPTNSAFYDVSVSFDKLRTGFSSLLCYRLPLHKASRLCSCLLLVVFVSLNKDTRVHQQGTFTL